MKKSFVFNVFLLTTLLFIGLSLTSAVTLSGECKLSASFVSQDPYPATPGEYVKLVFQLSGIDNPKCGEVTYQLVEGYPISFDPGVSSSIKVSSGVYATDYKSSLIAPFKVRVDKEAVDGENPIEVRFASKPSPNDQVTYQVQKFNLSIQDSATDFEVSIKDYSYATNKMTFQILNTGKYNVEALTVEVPKQNNIKVTGSNRDIIGSLDSNEDATFDYTATPKAGDLNIRITYTDSANVRRTLDKVVSFDPAYFENTKVSGGSKWIVYIIILVVIIGGFFWWRRSRKNKKKDF